MDAILARPFSGEEVIWLVVVLCITTVSTVKVVTAYKRRSQQDDMDATLKLEMVQRGMTAEDIERILAAKTRTPVNGPGRKVPSNRRAEQV